MGSASPRKRGVLGSQNHEHFGFSPVNYAHEISGGIIGKNAREDLGLLISDTARSLFKIADLTGAEAPFAGSVTRRLREISLRHTAVPAALRKTPSTFKCYLVDGVHFALFCHAQIVHRGLGNFTEQNVYGFHCAVTRIVLFLLAHEPQRLHPTSWRQGICRSVQRDRTSGARLAIPGSNSSHRGSKAHRCRDSRDMGRHQWTRNAISASAVCIDRGVWGEQCVRGARCDKRPSNSQLRQVNRCRRCLRAVFPESLRDVRSR